LEIVMVRTSIALLILLMFGHTARLVAAEQALNCQEALSTVEMNNCAGAEYEAADVELNRVYKAALGAIPEMATGEPPFDRASWEEALRASQRAWVAFRDAECEDHVAKFWNGGTGATVDIIGCKTEKTEQRTKELKARYEVE
jgi:uncharacterized protein YecT (DUF1311 family)